MSDPLPPIPLSAPDGEVLGYACPRCRAVCTGNSGGGMTPAEHSFNDAACHCLCQCGAVVPPEEYQCEACRVKADARMAALAKEQEPARLEYTQLYEKRLATAKDQDAALLLERLMSEISEEHYCAGWMTGLENALWAIVEGGPRGYGMADVSDENVAELRRLHEKSGGWWASTDDGLLFTADWPPAAATVEVQ